MEVALASVKDQIVIYISRQQFLHLRAIPDHWRRSAIERSLRYANDYAFWESLTISMWFSYSVRCYSGYGLDQLLLPFLINCMYLLFRTDSHRDHHCFNWRNSAALPFLGAGDYAVQKLQWVHWLLNAIWFSWCWWLCCAEMITVSSLTFECNMIFVVLVIMLCRNDYSEFIDFWMQYDFRGAGDYAVQKLQWVHWLLNAIWFSWCWWLCCAEMITVSSLTFECNMIFVVLVIMLCRNYSEFIDFWMQYDFPWK